MSSKCSSVVIFSSTLSRQIWNISRQGSPLLNSSHLPSPTGFLMWVAVFSKITNFYYYYYLAPAILTLQRLCPHYYIGPEESASSVFSEWCPQILESNSCSYIRGMMLLRLLHSLILTWHCYYIKPKVLICV